MRVRECGRVREYESEGGVRECEGEGVWGCESEGEGV